MKVSVHAGKRFLERVMNRSTYTCLDVDFAIRYLERALSSVVPNSSSKHFVLPDFQEYKAIYRQNTIVTIIPKGRSHV